MLARLWLCRTSSCSCSSHFSSSVSTSDDSRRSSKPSLAMLVCSCTRTQKDTDKNNGCRFRKVYRQTGCVSFVNIQRSSIISIILLPVVIRRMKNCQLAKLRPIMTQTLSILDASFLEINILLSGRDATCDVMHSAESQRALWCMVPLHPAWQPWQSSG